MRTGFPGGPRAAVPHLLQGGGAVLFRLRWGLITAGRSLVLFRLACLHVTRPSPASWTCLGRAGRRHAPGYQLMMPDDLFNDETQKPLGENRIEFGVLGQASQPAYLFQLPLGIRRRKLVVRLQLTNLFCVFEALREEVDERGIEIVDAVTKSLEFFADERIRIGGIFNCEVSGVPALSFGVFHVIRHALDMCSSYNSMSAHRNRNLDRLSELLRVLPATRQPSERGARPEHDRDSSAPSGREVTVGSLARWARMLSTSTPRSSVRSVPRAARMARAWDQW